MQVVAHLGAGELVLQGVAGVARGGGVGRLDGDAHVRDGRIERVDRIVGGEQRFEPRVDFLLFVGVPRDNLCAVRRCDLPRLGVAVGTGFGHCLVPMGYGAGATY